VDRVAGLEADDPLPAALGEERPRLTRILVQFRESRLGALEHRHRAGDVVVRLAVEPRDARMSVVGRTETALRLALLVVAVDLLDLEDGERAAVLVRERDPVAARLVLDGEAHRQRPRKAAREAHVLDHTLVVGGRHEARQGR
jgi:hypothetical protein